MKDVVVKDSEVHGKGLFATRHFKKGEQVLGWNDENEYLSEEEASALPEEMKSYVAIFRNKYLLIAEPERYMNHSCYPNTQTAEDGTDYAIRDIQVGEEITGSYTYIRTLKGFECRCSSAECQGVIAPTNRDPAED